MRTCYCAESSQYINQNITLCGWIENIRDHGELLFITLRDQTGIIQCITDNSLSNFAILKNINLESIIKINGKIVARSNEHINNHIATGKIEIHINKCEILSTCYEQIAFNSTDDIINSKYRFAFLRKNQYRKKINKRIEVIKHIRSYMHDHQFQEIQTPLLTGTSPEGARDFKVISRHKGKYYALPQAPQIFKQLLMSAGFDKYFQIAPCFRDEDSRADRSPTEFYQLDLEMAFITQETIFSLVEGLIKQIFDNLSFTSMTYEESMKKYGTDKPDLRFDLHIEELNELSIAKFDRNKITTGVRINRLFTRKEISGFDEIMKQFGYNGIGYIAKKDNEYTGSLKKLIEGSIPIENNQTLFLVNDMNARKICHTIIQYIKENKYIEPCNKYQYSFCWIKDFPMYELNDEGYTFMHNPFSDIYDINADPKNMIAKQYDLVCNGLELGSGAMRNHCPERMLQLFKHAGYTKEMVQKNFSALYNAFRLGTPPHGGIALGIERIIMILTESKYVRDVIVFPTLQNGSDHLMNAPS